MKKKLLIGAGILVIIVAISLFASMDGLSEGANLQINGVDLAGVPDGSYTGTYEFKRWSSTAVVNVKNHKIVEMAITGGTAGTGVVNELLGRVMQTQDTRVDAVSGATVTSKACLKAIENALENTST